MKVAKFRLPFVAMFAAHKVEGEVDVGSYSEQCMARVSGQSTNVKARRLAGPWWWRLKGFKQRETEDERPGRVDRA